MRPVICAFADSREQRAKGEDGSRKAIADDGNRGGGRGRGRVAAAEAPWSAVGRICTGRT